MDEVRYREAERRLWASVGTTPRESRVLLEGCGAHVRVQEVGEGHPILFLHGGPNAGATWAGLAAPLARTGHRCLLVDRPGTGLSEPLPMGPDDLGSFADGFVAEVLDALGIDRAHVVASSFGGFLALRAAAAAPERLDRMVQMACPAGAPGMGMPGFMKAMVTPGLGRLIGALPPSEGAARMIFRQIGHGASLDAGRIPPEFLDWYLALQRWTDTMAHESALIRSVASVRSGWHPALRLDQALLADVRTPTLLYWGDADAFGGAEVAHRLQATLPQAELCLVTDTGHLPWLDDPAAAADAVTQFVQQGLPTSPVT